MNPRAFKNNARAASDLSLAVRAAMASRAKLLRITTAALLAVGLAALVTPTAQAQQGTDPLPYSAGFLTTGNFVVGAVDFTQSANPAVNSFSTGTLTISGVPPNADILAAYLYWETIHLATVSNPQVGVEFDGYNVNDPDIPLVKKGADLPLTGGACYGSGNASYELTMMKADVLRLLPFQKDSRGVATGKRLVNGPHTVKLPDSGNGNNPPESAGATLFVVYRDPRTDRTVNPLRKIVVYDFANGDPTVKPYIVPSLTTVATQTVRGFYKSIGTDQTLAQNTVKAQISYILASSQPNPNERIFFNDSNSQPYPPNNQPILTNPSQGGSSSERSWRAPNPTTGLPLLITDVSSYMNPGNGAGGTPNYGETARTTIDHTPGGGYDCLTLGAVFFSTAIADAESAPSNGGDGLPDALEGPDAVVGHPLTNPDGALLPDLAEWAQPLRRRTCSSKSRL